MPKFFVEPGQIYDEEILVFGDDARHSISSLRMKIGDPITICNMNKRDYDCIISSVSGGVVHAEIISSSVCEAEPNYSITLYQCLPKGEKMEYVIQKAVELGAASIVPVLSSRCIAKPAGRDKNGKDKKTERYNRIAYEAAEQSGRGIVPVVHECINFERAVNLAKNDAISFICYEEEKKNDIRKFIDSKKQEGMKNNVISFFIGPEGGFSPDEISFAVESGIESVGLGNRILRTETASGFVLAVLSYETEL